MQGLLVYSQTQASITIINFQTFRYPQRKFAHTANTSGSRPLSPVQPLIHTPRLYTHLLWTSRVNGIVQHGPLWLALFVEHVFAVFISHCGIPVLHPFLLPNNRFHHVDIPHFIYSFITRRAFAAYPLFGRKNNAAVSIHETLRKSFVWTLQEKHVRKDFLSLCLPWVISTRYRWSSRCDG